MKIVAILQARCSSSRLPNKVMLKIMNKPMIQHQINRLKKSKLVDEIVIATSTDKSDDLLARLCKKLNLPIFRGSLNNVLDRFYHTANHYKADIVVRLTGDCPLIDPEIIDMAIQKHLLEENDYTSNIIIETYPDGLDVEVISISAIKEAWKNSKLKSEKEHVTTYIRKKSKYKKSNLSSEEDMSHYRWTVDEPADFEFVTKVYESLGKNEKHFSTSEIYDLLEKEPRLQDINCNIQRNAGYEKSLANDKIKDKL